jgi:predicted AAA+ superfamily ATPase
MVLYHAAKWQSGAVVDYLPRLVDGLLDELLVELPALFITGPRATGKTTTAASTTLRQAR